ncbi:MAG: DNA translocase FtsK 4TM domain-containing protein [Gammaproteobacteria bacterium]|nr:DNA translocase FtsK 4TM domain-containing protein [Gammaproteobacteria bacterium]
MVRGLKEGALFIFTTLMIYFLVVLYSYHPEDPGWTNQVSGKHFISNAGGVIGAWFADVLLLLFGYLAYLVPVMIGYTGWLIYKGRNPDGTFDVHKFWMRCVGFLLTLINGTGLASLHFATLPGNLPDNSSGGVLGNVVSNFLVGGFGLLGATLFLLTLFLVGVSLFTGLSWLTVMDHTGKYSLATVSFLRNKYILMQEYYEGRKARMEREEAVEADKKRHETRKPPKIEPVIKELPSSDRLEMERQVSLFESAPDSELPALSLLDIAEHSGKGYSREALEAMSRLVEMKLQDFGIEVEVESVHPGPIITRFEIQPAAGVKVSQITNLAKDLARALSVISLRVVEVIPGKPVIGIEIPNEHREMIYLSEILRSQEYDAAVSPLTLALGKDISGHPIVVDLAKMPHLLVAGTTGSGKSVAVNAMILSLLYKATPNDVRLIMIDPKMLELSVYEGIPHLLTPVVTDMKDAANALRWCVGEMERRYKLMASLGVRNIAGYNRKVKEAEDKGKPLTDPTYNIDGHSDPSQPPPLLTHLPSIVVVIDEFADMMMVVGKKVEELIARLAQKARASGVHLILATQRPSVNVITGLIKANIPARIAFQVSSKIDSRTILDQMGAESLLGHGDMLYMTAGSGVPMRVHGAFVSDQEVHRVVAEIKQTGEPDYHEDIVSEEQGGAVLLPGEVSETDSESDPLYDEAVRLVTETRRASISAVQRRLKIGYNRAARMIESMESAGIVSEMQSNGSREVLVAPPPKA